MVDRLNITKKIDGLGRVVIPKSVRDMMRISEGDELEIAVVDGWIGFRKKLNIKDERIKIAREVLEEKGLEVPRELL